MIQAVYAKAAPFLTPLFLVLALLGWGGYILQWGEIKSLQGALIKDKDKKIEVIVQTQDIAKEISKLYENTRVEKEIVYEKVQGDTHTIVKTDTVFLNTCISDVGVHHYNNYLATLASESGERVQEGAAP